MVGLVAARSASVRSGAVTGRRVDGADVGRAVASRGCGGPGASGARYRVTVTSTNGGIEEMSFQSSAAVQWLKHRASARRRAAPRAARAASPSASWPTA